MNATLYLICNIPLLVKNDITLQPKFSYFLMGFV